MYFNGSYLRVLTPRTTNGVVPLIINGEVQYKESFLPLSAKKQLEKKNARLTKGGHNQLVAIIETVGDAPAVRNNPMPVNQPPAQQVTETATNEVVQTEVAQPPKRGRKPNPNPKPKNQQ